MQVNPKKNTISFKLVYYGPGLSGKTTNLVHLHRQSPTTRRGELLRLDTETERTLFFDYFPLNIGEIGGYGIKLDLFTVPGQSFYQQTRRVLLEGVDGLVFVADSSPSREEANIISLADMYRSLDSWGRSREETPVVFQWNKRDVQGAMSTALLQKTLNPEGAPSFEAIATTGEGVLSTQNALISMILQRVRASGRGRAHG